jgi:hypothetical protein
VKGIDSLSAVNRYVKELEKQQRIFSDQTGKILTPEKYVAVNQVVSMVSNRPSLDDEIDENFVLGSFALSVALFGVAQKIIVHATDEEIKRCRDENVNNLLVLERRKKISENEIEIKSGSGYSCGVVKASIRIFFD